MSREQADAVALANDCHAARWDTFYKNAIASGSIIPPSGESASVRRTDFAVGLCVLCLGACGVVAMLTAYFWRG